MKKKIGKHLHISKREELSTCLDNCCEVGPKVIVDENILIRCRYCSNLVSHTGHSEKILYDAMIEWNLLIRDS